MKRDPKRHKTIRDIATASQKDYLTIWMFIRRGLVPKSDLHVGGRRYYSLPLFKQAVNFFKTPKLSIRKLLVATGLNTERLDSLLKSGEIPRPEVPYGKVFYYSKLVFDQLVAKYKNKKFETRYYGETQLTVSKLARACNVKVARMFALINRGRIPKPDAKYGKRTVYSRVLYEYIARTFPGDFS